MTAATDIQSHCPLAPGQSAAVPRAAPPRIPAVILWRTLVALPAALWMAGLTFYAAFVIHTAAAVLGAESTVGFITQRVTNFANLLSALALPLLLADHLRSRPGRLRRLTLLIWTGLAVSQIALAALHPAMDRLLNPADLDVLDPRRFHLLHKIYLWIASLEILSFPLYAACLLALWHRRDTHPTA